MLTDREVLEWAHATSKGPGRKPECRCHMEVPYRESMGDSTADFFEADGIFNLPVHVEWNKRCPVHGWPKGSDIYEQANTVHHHLADSAYYDRWRQLCQ